jgi:parvulin-like peptidyl-prolyl isomerase
MKNRLAALNRLIDMRLMTRKARQAGMEQDPAYLARVNEYKKTHLINIHRDALFRDWEPGDRELRAYYEKNRDHIRVKERRKVRMVVLKTEQEAREVKQKIESGEITIFQAAADYSIDPNTKKTLGEIGWVPAGSGFPELDKVTFALGPDEIGGPVESPAGWHLVQILDIRDAYYDDIEDEATRTATRRRYIDEKLDAYVINLRNNEFNVEVYDDTFFELAQQEVDWYKEVSEKTQKSPEQIIKDIGKLKR